ncbi:MAG: AHH domain-containing protein [Aquabacterium sp.]|uniref:AHH domain-containing protein n=1 Tax=Aquabacterium sp. TaxID=1872578 RepID=UPI0027233031|nr:AHH domain-containing protein [Aquabacterium sp.]MDO9006087.1 AHH domain-containing protein [Aquabacterium sp.]
MLGNTSKDSQYLKLMNGLIKADGKHPKHKGVKMQAHHILSADGVKLSGLASKLEDFGYDINLKENLAFLPCTLQGACHLGVQPHRGNHTAISDREESDYDDDDHPRSYHLMVAKKVEMLKLPVDKACTGSDDPARSQVKHKMDVLSKSVLGMICRTPNLARLTKIADHFSIGNHVGCSGADAVKDHRESTKCPTGRNHLERQGPGQRKEKISYASIGLYGAAPGK